MLLCVLSVRIEQMREAEKGRRRGWATRCKENKICRQSRAEEDQCKDRAEEEQGLGVVQPVDVQWVVCVLACLGSSVAYASPRVIVLPFPTF